MLVGDSSSGPRPAAAGGPDLILPAEAGTLDRLFRERVQRTPDALAYRHYDTQAQCWRDLTWREMDARIARWRSALEAEGLGPGDRAAIMLPNGPDWVCFDQAALGSGLVVVPLYVNDRADNVAFILRETGAALLVIEGGDQWNLLRPSLAQVSGLRRIVCCREGPAGDRRLANLQDWLPASPAPILRRREPDAGALATVVYTSGTVGRPKGVMLTHRNILWNTYASYCSNPVYGGDLFLSFLPLSHMLERTLGYYLPVMAGSTVAYARSVNQLAEDLPLLRPTVLISVPRIYERVYGRIKTQAERSAATARLFARAVDTGWARFLRSQRRGPWRPALLAWPLWKRLVAAKVLDRLGGRIRIAVCGGAPLSTEVARVFIGLGLPLVQGYGMTEASPVVAGNSLDDNEPASVGRPLRDVEIRLDAHGELLVRSPGVMQGYWNDPPATAQALDAEGWLHTGDRARLQDGRIYITGRIKEIVVLSNGEKVSPADMELAIARDPLFEQVMIVGEGRPYLSALVVLNGEHWRSFAGQQGIDPAALDDRRVLDQMCARVAALLSDFPGYAQVRRVTLSVQPWTVDNELLTPTLKLRRARIQEQFSAAIDQMYAGH